MTIKRCLLALFVPETFRGGTSGHGSARGAAARSLPPRPLTAGPGSRQPPPQPLRGPLRAASSRLPPALPGSVCAASRRPTAGRACPRSGAAGTVWTTTQRRVKQRPREEGTSSRERVKRQPGEEWTRHRARPPPAFPPPSLPPSLPSSFPSLPVPSSLRLVPPPPRRRRRNMAKAEQVLSLEPQHELKFKGTRRPPPSLAAAPRAGRAARPRSGPAPGSHFPGAGHRRQLKCPSAPRPPPRRGPPPAAEPPPARGGPPAPPSALPQPRRGWGRPAGTARGGPGRRLPRAAAGAPGCARLTFPGAAAADRGGPRGAAAGAALRPPGPAGGVCAAPAEGSGAVM